MPQADGRRLVSNPSQPAAGRWTEDELIAAVEAGDLVKARAVNESLLPIYTGIFRTQGTILVKAALNLLGFGVGGVRLPLVEATEAEVAQLREDLTAAGISL
jgi:4-hydroxy-tetrahydrodipicolinate synthase